MKSQPSAKRRAWRRAKSKAVCDAMRGVAALEGFDLPASNDVGMVRARARCYVDHGVLKALCGVAARTLIRDNPKPE